MEKVLETATLAAGCFWCVEAVFDDLKGVEDVVSGYSGGHKGNPTYQEKCSLHTGLSSDQASSGQVAGDTHQDFSVLMKLRDDQE